MRLYRYCCLAGLAIAVTGATPFAVRAADPAQGFATVIQPNFTGEELRAHEDTWALEVDLKPIRMAYVQAVNPRTGAKSSEMVWYLVYRIINRPTPKPPLGTESTPVNVQDASPPALCIPRATLVIEDPDVRGAVTDSIVPEALPEIMARERLPLKTSVQMAGPLPKPTATDTKAENAEYGVFMFRGVNPRTTSFSIFLSGFSNAYKIGKDESGKPLILRRTIQVPYRRFADRYDQFAKEIRQEGEPKWIYVPDEAAVAKK
jgi:hypothetical protein